MFKLGATGKFPQGKLNKEDEGELRMAVRIESNKIVIDFGKEVKWFGLGKDEARSLASVLINKANLLT